MRVVPLTLAQANELVERIHRHHKKVTGHRFSLGVINDNGELVGACIVGRPTARMTDQYSVAEVTRLVTDGTYNACSILYAAAARAAKAMGFERIQTFILDSEPGTSLRASGWEMDGISGGGSWDSPGRGRVDKAPTVPKSRWVKELNRAVDKTDDDGEAA